MQEDETIAKGIDTFVNKYKQDTNVYNSYQTRHSEMFSLTWKMEKRMVKRKIFLINEECLAVQTH